MHMKQIVNERKTGNYTESLIALARRRTGWREAASRSLGLAMQPFIQSFANCKRMPFELASICEAGYLDCCLASPD